ncbi:MAG: NUDIX hydrolase [Candidatus Eremiobacteraeota bacterium]|nr:NUDIX hydrolase [Candidatus Eremiobacteraeota bacterium]
MEKPQWSVLSSRYVLDSPHFRLRCDELKLPGGAIIPDYYVREAEGFVIVLAITTANEIVLIEQYRYGHDSIITELPAGTLDPGEDPLVCAKRELLEETGYTAPRWQPIFSVPAEPVRSNSIMHCYLARDAVLQGIQSLDVTEQIDVKLCSLHELRRLLYDGKIQSAASIAAAYAALERLADP